MKRNANEFFSHHKDRNLQNARPVKNIFSIFTFLLSILVFNQMVERNAMVRYTMAIRFVFLVLVYEETLR